MEDRNGAAVAAAVHDFTTALDAPLYVVTAGNADAGVDLGGCLVEFATQCSVRPPRFLVCVSRLNHTFAVTERSRGLAVHVLGEEQHELAELFGERTEDTFPKFEHCEWHPGVTGAPLLDDCAAWIEGLVVDRFDTGDHVALLLRPLAGGSGPRPGALTVRTAPSLHPGHPASA
jgi:flavin reductase (DIM6/NTAB) family NADH-FMN oxidoreductase RutF